MSTAAELNVPATPDTGIPAATQNGNVAETTNGHTEQAGPGRRRKHVLPDVQVFTERERADEAFPEAKKANERLHLYLVNVNDRDYFVIHYSPADAIAKAALQLFPAPQQLDGSPRSRGPITLNTADQALAAFKGMPADEVSKLLAQLQAMQQGNGEQPKNEPQADEQPKRGIRGRK